MLDYAGVYYNKIDSGMEKLVYTLKNILLITLPTIIIMLLVLEFTFRTISLNNIPAGYFDETDKMFLFYHKGSSVSRGRVGDIDVQWRINNMGWNYPIDYHHKDGQKLIAVIGDSFIEALLISVEKNYPFLLNQQMRPDYKVYSFGKSGAPMSQYLHISRYVNKYFSPEILIINVVHNDFDESIYELYPDKHHFLQISFDKEGNLFEVPPESYLRSSFEKYRWWRGVLYKSALYRFLNRSIIAAGNRAFLRFYPTDFEANIRVENIYDYAQEIYKATDYIIRTIKKENTDKRIIFVLDASRNAIYKGTLDESRVKPLHHLMKELCRKYEVELIDLTYYMQQDYEKNRIKFNSDTDGHWNEYGHEFVAGIIYDYLMETL